MSRAGSKSSPSSPRGHHWKETEARTVLDEFERSGMTRGAFARQRGISLARLDYWRRRLASTPSSAFVAVTVPDAAHHHLEIEVGGVLLRVREDLDPTRLARLVATLRGAEAHV
jgi:hypothetical protein